jgi:two-component system chemotaxis response regulator CheB
MSMQKVRVLVVEDSKVTQLFLVHMLRSDADFEVIGTANNGEEAIAFVAHTKPDVVLMDVHLPKIDGLEATRRIMETQPVPVVMASATLDSDEVSATFAALQAGALAFVVKPGPLNDPKAEEVARQLKQTLKLMSEVKVVRRWPDAAKRRAAAPLPMRPKQGIPRVVVIGASTGGPPVLKRILSGLPRNLPWPILIVQHISAGFLPGLAKWLSESGDVPVCIAASGLAPAPGCAYLAPDGFHMGVDRQGRITLADSEPESGLRPAVGYLFRSAAEVYGARAVGVLLTGMGRDGADDLKRLKDLGALTFAQDKESSIVHGMPGEAVALGAASYVLSPEEIAAALAGLV